MTEDRTATRSSATAPKRRAALGRGLGALLGDSQREQPLEAVSAGSGPQPAPDASASGLVSLPIASIQPHPEQPRTHFDEDALEELAQSIASRGLIQPVIVRPVGGGNYQLVAGERRWRAAQKARLHEIPALVRTLDDRDVTALALIENIQREDLNPIEEARAYHRLTEREGMSQAEIAKLVDKSRSHIANLMRLLALPEDVLAMVEKGALSMGHARALINSDAASVLAAQAVERGLSVREVEKRARREAPVENGRETVESHRRSARAPRSEDDADIAAVGGHLEEFLGLPVKITADADPRSGAVVIRYRTLDQLDLICQRLTGGGI